MSLDTAQCFLWVYDQMDVSTIVLPYYLSSRKLQVNRAGDKVLLYDKYHVDLSTTC